MRLVIISDTHGLHRQVPVPDGDILIHAGDLTQHGDLSELADFDAFLGELPHKHKIIIAGNHDFCFERYPEEAQKALTNGIYLLDEVVTLEGISFYGSPWTPKFFDWAFMLSRGEAIREKWKRIPPNVDVLITHGPPSGIGDLTWNGDLAGCQDLLKIVRQVKPKYHIFGHIHEGYGTFQDGETTFINASSCNLTCELTNPPLIINFELP